MTFSITFSFARKMKLGDFNKQDIDIKTNPSPKQLAQLYLALSIQTRCQAFLCEDDLKPKGDLAFEEIGAFRWANGLYNKSCWFKIMNLNIPHT